MCCKFRSENQVTYRSYMRDLRRFMIELAEVEEPGEREKLSLERRKEIADAAHDIQSTTRRTLQKNLTSWSLGITGGVWSFSTGIPLDWYCPYSGSFRVLSQMDQARLAPIPIFSISASPFTTSPFYPRHYGLTVSVRQSPCGHDHYGTDCPASSYAGALPVNRRTGQ